VRDASFCFGHPLVMHSMPIPGAAAVADRPRHSRDGQRRAAGVI